MPVTLLLLKVNEANILVTWKRREKEANFNDGGSDAGVEGGNRQPRKFAHWLTASHCIQCVDQ